jgi:CRP/FNR family transcriptional regulator, cyclic AMP receptor protein
VMNDIGHLDRVKSPLAAVARRLGYSSSRPIAVSWNGPPPCKIEATTVLPAHDGTVDSGLRASQHLAADAELFEGLTSEEVTTLVSLGHTISCRAGDSVLNPGDPGREIFVILSGTFQVQRRSISPSTVEVKVLKILSAGETFGEIRFLRDELRHASVIARQDSRLLVLNAKVLDRLVTTAPKVAAKVFRNIAKIIAMRLCDGVRFLRMPKPRRSKALMTS